MRFSIGIKNLPAGTAYWSVDCAWLPEYGTSPLLRPSQRHTFTVPKDTVYLRWQCFDTGKNFTNEWGASDWMTIKDGANYIIDFATSLVAKEEVSPPAPPVKYPILAMLIPWSPLFGPPLPKGFFPPWPMWMSRWTEIPGYPKIPEGTLSRSASSRLIPLVYE